MNQQIVNRQELIKEIRKPGRVYVTAILNGDIANHTQVVKADLLWQLEQMNGSVEFEIGRDGDGDLYIN